jgi:hypothetical protein
MDKYAKTEDTMGKIFAGGIPTLSDVENLMAAFPIESGSVVSYSSVEFIIQNPYGSHRFGTVTDAWRKRVFRESGIDSEAAGGEFRFLTPDESVTVRSKIFHRIGRAVRRNYVKVAAINAIELSEQKQKEHSLLMRENGAILAQMQQSEKVIRGPGSVKTTVRIAAK